LKDNHEKQNFDKLDFKKFDELEQYILHKLFTIDKSIKDNLKKYNFHKLYKELLNFCTLDLSSFYFDIRKDVLYCDNLNSKKRKDCIIVLNIILECLLKWFAPIFVFTTEEIYSLVGNDKKSIHEQIFPEIPSKWKNENLDVKWKQLFKIKQKANIAIEEKRTSKEIGSSLEAEIKIIADNDIYNLLEGLDLAEYFITSKAEKNKSEKKKEIIIKVKKTKGNKCPRCWKILESNCTRCEEASAEVA
jgi:isoleucyl-tRNA synthetase